MAPTRGGQRGQLFHGLATQRQLGAQQVAHHGALRGLHVQHDAQLGQRVEARLHGPHEVVAGVLRHHADLVGAHLVEHVARPLEQGVELALHGGVVTRQEG